MEPTHPPAAPARRRNADYRWTLPKVMAFLEALAQSGKVAEAARAVGMSPRSAFRLRARLAGTPLERGWEVALRAGVLKRAERRAQGPWDGGLGALVRQSRAAAAQGPGFPAQGRATAPQGRDAAPMVPESGGKGLFSPWTLSTPSTPVAPPRHEPPRACARPQERPRPPFAVRGELLHKKDLIAMAYDTTERSAMGFDNDAAGDGTVTLNTLIGTLIDSIEGYQKAAADTTNARFAEMFNARAQERQQVLTKLQATVARLGGNPEDDGTTAGAAHRGWMNLKEAVLGQDDETIVKTVEEGEDYLKAKFKAALENVDLPAEARAAVEEAWTSVKAGHDEMSALKHAID
jgi:uncharacterized protein (TIGR02284 family)